MNVDTGELRRFSKEEIEKVFFEDFEPVPENLQEEANALLKDKDGAMVDMTKDTPLVKWAKKKKADKEKKAKRKMREASRKRNRS